MWTGALHTALCGGARARARTDAHVARACEVAGVGRLNPPCLRGLDFARSRASRLQGTWNTSPRTAPASSWPANAKTSPGPGKRPGQPGHRCVHSCERRLTLQQPCPHMHARKQGFGGQCVYTPPAPRGTPNWQTTASPTPIAHRHALMHSHATFTRSLYCSQHAGPRLPQVHGVRAR